MSLGDVLSYGFVGFLDHNFSDKEYHKLGAIRFKNMRFEDDGNLEGQNYWLYPKQG